MYKRRNTASRAATVALVLGLAAGFAPTATAGTSTGAPFTITAGTLRIGLSSTGTVTSLLDTVKGHDYASAGHLAPLIKLVADGAEQKPTGLSYDCASSTYTFSFGAKGIKVGVKVVAKSGYSTLEATSVKAPKGVDVQTLLWGPITTDISQTVGETVGVVHDTDFAIGIHGLNDKTPAGWPEEYKNLSYTDGPGEPLFNWNYGWFAARQTGFGSILQAYTYDYTKTRQRYIGWGDTNEPSEPVPALSGDDALIKGSKIALFGSTPEAVLGTLSHIETGEKLPHPTVDGEWQKTSQGASQSFLVLSDLNQNTVDQASTYAIQAGLRYLYSLPGADGPWQSAGHYQFNSAFGGSDAGATQLVDKAASHGLKVGVHTLSNLVDGNDSYVRPVPSEGLATMGSVRLTKPLDASAKLAYVDGNTIFSGGSEQYIKIGNELLTYSGVTKVAGSADEYQVQIASRGVSGTTAAAHTGGDAMSRMQRYAYGQFVAGMPIIGEIAARFAQIPNSTGTKAMSYDGLETGSLAGYGLFGTNRLVNDTYRGLKSQSDFISEASNLLPGTWDATTRASWGEDHGDPDRTALSALRYMPYFDRNDMPNMMGWRGFRPGFSTQNQEWLLSKMAGYNAGTGLQASVAELNAAGNTAEVLNAWKEWEAARNSHAFTSRQMTAMRDMKSDWHLETVTPGKQWNLYDVDFPATALSAPNNGSASTFDYTNTHAAQPLRFQLQAKGGTVTNPSFTLDGQTVSYQTTVPSGGYLVADGTATAAVYDSTWHRVATVTAQGSASFKAGAQSIGYTATGSGGTSQLSFRTYGAPQQVKAPVTITSPTTVQRGGTATVTSTYTNTSTTAQKNATVGLVVPTGWSVRPVGRATFPRIDPGSSVTVTWKVTTPANAPVGDNPLIAHVMYTGARLSSEASTRISVPNPLTVQGPSIVAPGASSTVTTTYTNGTRRPLSQLALTLTPPSGWTATATTPATFTSLAAGQKATTTWKVTAPANATPGTATYTGHATYQGGPVTDEADGHFSVPYGSLSSAFDNAGISDDGNPRAADLDGGGRSLSAQTLTAAGLTPGASVAHDGLTFTWPQTTPGSKDNVLARGQMIKLDGTGTKLGFLTTGTNGASSGTGTITYTDGTTQTYALAVSDWTDSAPATGADTLATLPRRNASAGGVTGIPVRIYASTVPLQAGKTVAFLTLPQPGAAMHIFATAIG